MTTQTRRPLQEAAFEHPETRAAWLSLRRRARTRLVLCTVGWVMVFVGISVLDGFGVIPLSEVPAGRRSNLLGGVLSLTLFAYVCLLYLCRRSLSCLKRIRAVLEAHPWEAGPLVRRQAGVKDANGVAVRILPGGGAGGVGKHDALVSAQAPLFRRRWPQALEEGAWCAGDPRGRAVLALPGGTGLMEITQRR